MCYVYAFLIVPMYTTRPAHMNIFDSMILISGEEWLTIRRIRIIRFHGAVNLTSFAYWTPQMWWHLVQLSLTCSFELRLRMLWSSGSYSGGLVLKIGPETAYGFPKYFQANAKIANWNSRFLPCPFPLFINHPIIFHESLYHLMFVCLLYIVRAADRVLKYSTDKANFKDAFVRTEMRLRKRLKCASSDFALTRDCLR